MAWSNPSTRATNYKVTSSNWNEIVNDLLFLAEVAYVEFTADVSITATTVGTAQQIVTAGAITYTADPILIEFFIPRYLPIAALTHFVLRDGTTVLGTLTSNPASDNLGPINMRYRTTPTAASHTYNVAAWNAAAGTGTVKAGTGGAAGDATTYLPGWVRVTHVPV